jgi:hypothetical protein
MGRKCGLDGGGLGGFGAVIRSDGCTAVEDVPKMGLLQPLASFASQNTAFRNCGT